MTLSKYKLSLLAEHKIQTPEEDLKRGDWVYTPDNVYGSAGEKHNIFQWDDRIVYSEHFGHEPVFYKIEIPC